MSNCIGNKWIGRIYLAVCVLLLILFYYFIAKCNEDVPKMLMYFTSPLLIIAVILKRLVMKSMFKRTWVYVDICIYFILLILIEDALDLFLHESRGNDGKFDEALWKADLTLFCIGLFDFGFVIYQIVIIIKKGYYLEKAAEDESSSNDDSSADSDASRMPEYSFYKTIGRIYLAVCVLMVISFYFFIAMSNEDVPKKLMYFTSPLFIIAVILKRLVMKSIIKKSLVYLTIWIYLILLILLNEYHLKFSLIQLPITDEKYDRALSKAVNTLLFIQFFDIFVVICPFVVIIMICCDEGESLAETGVNGTRTGAPPVRYASRDETVVLPLEEEAQFEQQLKERSVQFALSGQKKSDASLATMECVPHV